MAIAAAVRDERITRFHWRIQFLGSIHLFLASVDLGILTFALAQLVGLWNLTPIHIGTIAISSAIGTFLGGIVLGNAADRIGRRTTLQLAVAAAALGTGLGALAWDYISLAAFQFIAGIGVGNVGSVAGAFIGEFAPAKYRGRLSAFLELSWITGALVAALASLLILPAFGWRLAFAFGATPFLWVLIQRRYTPESPRYLIASGKQSEAERLLNDIQQKYGLSYHHLIATSLSRTNGSLWQSLRELWSGQLARRSACTWILWFVLAFSYYGIFVWLPTLLASSGYGVMRSIQFMLIFTAVQIPTILAVAFLVDIIGRKRVLVPALFVCSIASYLFGKATSVNEMLLWGSIVSLSNITGWGIMLGYTAELFPTRVRGTGAGAASAFGRIGAIIVPAAITLLLGSWSQGYEMVFAMFAAILFFGAINVAILGEETKGLTLEEIAA